MSPETTFVIRREKRDVAPERSLIRKKTFSYAGSESSRTVRRSFSQRLLAASKLPNTSEIQMYARHSQSPRTSRATCETCKTSVNNFSKKLIRKRRLSGNR